MRHSFYCNWHQRVEITKKRGFNEVNGKNDQTLCMCDEGLEEYAYSVYMQDRKKKKKKNRVSSKVDIRRVG